MTLTETYKDICDDIGLTLVFASLNQANTIADQLKGIDLPALVVLPYDETDSIDPDTTQVHRSAPLEAWLLTRVDKASIDASKTLIQEKAVEPMLLKARQFIKRLKVSDIVRKDANLDDVTYKPLYSEFDANLFGVSLITSLPLNPPSTCLA